MGWPTPRAVSTGLRDGRPPGSPEFIGGGCLNRGSIWPSKTAASARRGCAPLRGCAPVPLNARTIGRARARSRTAGCEGRPWASCELEHGGHGAKPRTRGGAPPNRGGSLERPDRFGSEWPKPRKNRRDRRTAVSPDGLDATTFQQATHQQESSSIYTQQTVSRPPRYRTSDPCQRTGTGCRKPYWHQSRCPWGPSPLVSSRARAPCNKPTRW
jgi:hypothetical protein